MASTVDQQELEEKVKAVYRDVADRPEEDYHFEMGRGLAERLGYSPADLDRIPAAAIDSFAGVGYHFDLAALSDGENVLDLGSGSGTDVFVAALHVGETGSVTGIDMTEEQLEKSRTLRDEAGFDNVSFEQGYIEELPVDDETFDVVISNGVINLSAQKEQVFREVSRVLRPGGRLAISDIISEEQLSESTKSNADLWAACIGGAMQEHDYTTAIEAAGMTVVESRANPEYEFLTDQARNACSKYGVKSSSLLAEK